MHFTENDGHDSCIRDVSAALGRVDPRGQKWVILGSQTWPHNGGVEVIVTTDVPILLFAYVSWQIPKKRRGTHTKRGITFHHSADVRWSYYAIVCQAEKGWGYTHTFYFNCFADKPEIWWRFGGRTTQFVFPGQPIWSASRSSFYHWKCLPPPSVDQAECQKEYDNPGGFCQGWNAEAQTVHPTTNHRISRLDLILGPHNEKRRGNYIVGIEEYIAEADEGITLTEQTFYWNGEDVDKPPQWYAHQLPSIEVTIGQNLRFVVHSVGDWEYFSDGRWKSGKFYAAMHWWQKIDTDPYPNGKRQVGYNFRDGSGNWDSYDDDDHAFCGYG